MGATMVPQSVGLRWDESPDKDAVAYNIYYGTESRAYLNLFQVGNNTNCVITGLVGGVTYYFAATAVDTFGMEGDFSEELVYTPQFQLDLSFAFSQPVTNVIVQSSADLLNWQDCVSTPTNGVFRVIPETHMLATFYRAWGVSP